MTKRAWEKQKPKATDLPKPRRTPMNIWKRPPKLPPMAPLTDRERREAA